MPLMHDYVIQANFTTTPCLKEKFFAFALVVFNSSAMGIYLCKTSQLYNFKTRLGGEHA